jgi:hypothetical protein
VTAPGSIATPNRARVSSPLSRIDRGSMRRTRVDVEPHPCHRCGHGRTLLSYGGQPEPVSGQTNPRSTKGPALLARGYSAAIGLAVATEDAGKQSAAVRPGRTFRLDVALVGIAPEPAPLGRADDRVSRLEVVLLRVTARRGDAAADVAAGRAQVEGDPVRPLLEALRAHTLLRFENADLAGVVAHARHDLSMRPWVWTVRVRRVDPPTRLRAAADGSQSGGACCGSDQSPDEHFACDAARLVADDRRGGLDSPGHDEAPGERRERRAQERRGSGERVRPACRVE